MNDLRRHGYFFASKEQWDACLQSGADRSSPNSIRPFTAFQPQKSPQFPSKDAFAPVWTRVREILWRDGAGALYRLPCADSPCTPCGGETPRRTSGDDEPCPPCDGEKPRVIEAPPALARGLRIVATINGLWVIGRAVGTVECFEPETLSRRFVVRIPDARVLDIADDGRDGVRALIVRDHGWQVVPIDCAGKVGIGAVLEDVETPRELISVPGDGPIVVLAHDGTELLAFGKEGGKPRIRIALAALGNCFVGCHLATDRRGRIFIAGVDDCPRQARVVILDGSGAKIGDVELSEEATGLAAGTGGLLVTSASGLYFLQVPKAADPHFVAQVETTVVTPMLEAPDKEDGRRWLRIEADASLPEGASIEIAYTATDDAEMRDELRKVADDSSIPQARRAQIVRSAANVFGKLITFFGREASPDCPAGSFAVPLHDVREKYLWVAVTLAASGEAKLPELSRLSVLYPGRTLMEDLPAIYQREEAQSGGFTRGLVSVLETTTQDLDARIADLGRNIHPDHASEPWLDYVARWLGLPWDDALDEGQKRCIVKAAAKLASGRGTRAGLETLLDCLVPGKQRRFRLVDATVDHGFAWLGGVECAGAALPAILGGLPATAARLGVQAALGVMRLPCPGEPEEDGTSRFLGKLRVDVAATAEERERWQPWLSRLVTEMVPVGTRAAVRWTTASGLRGDRLDESLKLEGDYPPRLGTDAITGEARLPRASAILPASVGGDGPTLG